MSLSKEQWLRETGGFPLRALLFAQLAAIPAPLPRRSGRSVMFDIETEPISRAFLGARNSASKTRNAPAPTVACAYSNTSRRYSFYEPVEFARLLRVLQEAQ